MSREGKHNHETYSHIRDEGGTIKSIDTHECALYSAEGIKTFNY